MLFPNHLCVIRGGGDLGTGAALRLNKAGFPVLICDLANPLTVRRTVALSSAISDAEITVEGVKAKLIKSVDEISNVLAEGSIPVLISETLPNIDRSVVIDARMLKQTSDTKIADAPLVIGLGPGFVAKKDCHAIIETLRGPRLGRVIWKGSAEPNTSIPDPVINHTTDRVLRAQADGTVTWDRYIGEVVKVGEILGRVGDSEVVAPFDGLLRGLILNDIEVDIGTKIGDIDPRGHKVSVNEVSDKALSIGGGVLEAVFCWLNQTP